ncbi:penicillin-insensitive murein endopeptidase [Pseudochelatococcus contaminans]|uniref:Penicillin-insensitive murein endopeptidase n=1 Tax=Pseudochelatococcus contaminans TaxID=1538103 RepID=A0A7W5Z330_9HYPH|nr:penicillin-insensitive murein endopeptidase [Pseudochelatococcus contaminans]MBB3809228.1 penicillin-insensitive murein endopeptidase [Pseudochelatococcus contaminans]
MPAFSIFALPISALPMPAFLHTRLAASILVVASVLACGSTAIAQDNASQEAARRQTVLKSLPQDAARRLFGLTQTPSQTAPQVYGFYSKGCVGGAVELPADGDNWQVMRPSRNRAFGHPVLIDFLKDIAASAPQAAGWPGLLVGDIGQPRGGPMLTGHASHQNGIDADIWLTPSPTRRFTQQERNNISAVNVVAKDWNDIDPARWTQAHHRLLRHVASQPQVARLFVNPAIKKALCREATGNRAWLSKVRPTPGHNYHFHIRLACPGGNPVCRDQDPPPKNDGCGPELDWWFSEEARRPKKPTPPPPPLTLADLPAQCAQVLAAP